MSFIVAIEGVDAAGKKTQSIKLKEYIEKTYQETVQLFAFPRYDGPVGATLFKLLQSQMTEFSGVERAQIIQSLMLADRLSTINQFEAPFIICDRYYMSGVIYGLSDDLAEPWLYNMHATMPKANLQILINVNPTVAAQRRGKPRDEYEKNLSKQLFIQKKYWETWIDNNCEDPFKWALVDGSKTEDDVHAQIIDCFEYSFGHSMLKGTSDAAI